VIGNLNLLFGLVLGEAQKLRALDFEETSILYNTALQRLPCRIKAICRREHQV